MKKTLATVLAAILCLSIPMLALAGEPLIDVRIAIHGNVGGAPLAGVAVEQGFFAEEGINPIITVVESGPSEMAAMRADARTLDCGFIGAGVAWNAMDPSGNELKFIFLDNLSNSEGMVARKGVFTDANGNGFYDYDELYAGLKGKTLYVDTATTPGGWFKDLLNKIHTELNIPAEEQLWIETETADYVKDYTAPNANAEYKITVVQLANENMPAAMSTSDASRVDIAVGYAPVPGIIVNSNSDTEFIAATDTHLPDKYFPSTWVASQKWLEESPEAAQKVVNALVKALNFRGDPANEAASLAAGENLAQKPAGSFDAAAAVWPTAEEYKGWFTTPDSQGYEYMRVLYDAKKSGVPEGTEAKALEDCMNFTFVLNTLAAQ
ncbi:MAG: ABC transporter substrate-binding protein [Candidatus Limiplasma sp.]|nr:ABC transporter substrate-binding protein [Candidatus Limiplasma sp.]